jgi:hypothetical protein
MDPVGGVGDGIVGNAKANDVAENGIAGRRSATDVNAHAVIAGNEIAIRRSGSADQVVRRIGDQDAIERVPGIHRPRDVQADVTAFDDSVRRVGDLNAVAEEAVDDQCANHAIARGDLESVRARAGAGPVEFDNRRAGKTRLCSAVDRHGVDEVRQRAAGNDRQTAGANVEDDVVGARTGIGVQDRLLQRAGAGSIGIDDGERG